MQRLVQTFALGAALASIGVSIWREDGAGTALVRALVAYLAFFIVSALLVLVYRAGVLAENRPKAPPPTRGGAGPKGAAKA